MLSLWSAIVNSVKRLILAGRRMHVIKAESNLRSVSAETEENEVTVCCVPVLKLPSVRIVHAKSLSTLCPLYVLL